MKHAFVSVALAAVVVVTLLPGAAEAQTTTLVPQMASELVYDSHSGKIYASVPSYAASNPNTVIPIDPVTGAIGAPILSGLNPNRLALSDDGRYLYVGLDGAIRQVDLTGETAGREIALPGLGSCSKTPAADIAVQPGHPEVIAVMEGCYEDKIVAIYDHGSRKPAVASVMYGTCLQFGSDNGVYTIGATYDFKRFEVTADGVTESSSVYRLLGGSQSFVFAGGRVYAETGEVADPAAGRLLWTFALGTTWARPVLPDPANGQVLFLEGTAVSAYDANTYLRLWSLDLSGYRVHFPGSFVKTVAHRYALSSIGEDKILLFDDSTAGSNSTYRLRIDKAGTGYGTVKSWTGDLAGGISCGTQCSEDLRPGAVVTLSAVADDRSVFNGWAGDDDCTDGVVTMSAAHACTAVFDSATAFVPVRRIPFSVRGLAYDPASARLYATIADTNGPDGNSIIAIEPVSGQVQPPVWVGSRPSSMAISDDRQHLYVALEGALSVARLNLPALTPEMQFRLGDYRDPRSIRSLRIQPENANVVVVNRTDAFPTVAYEGGIARPSSLPTITWLDFGNASTVHARSSSDLVTASLDASGLTVARTLPGIFSTSCPKYVFSTSSPNGVAAYANGRVYGECGEVIDLTTGTRVGTFGAGHNGVLITVDTVHGMVLYLDGESLTAYDVTTLKLLWQTSVPLGGASIQDAIQWNGTGLAFRTDQAVFVADYSAMMSKRTLMVSTLGSGNGIISSSAGINCRTDSAVARPADEAVCTAQLPFGAVATLVATPSPWSTFAGWSGDPDCVDGQVTMTEGRVCTATFTYLPQLTLYLSGHGVVTSDPAGMSCSTNCSARFPLGAVVTLTATAARDSVFRGWVGCAGTTATTSVTIKMSSDKRCSASFAIRAPDFNLDGRPDITWRNRVTGEIDIWLMTGLSRNAQITLAGPTDPNWETMGAADFNKDGYTDLVMRNKATGANQVWYMNGTSHLPWATGTISSMPDLAWQIVAVADFNGDGWPDLVWRTSSGAVDIDYMYDDYTLGGTQVVGPGDMTWEVAAADDFDGDAKADLLWRNRVTGQVRIWYLDGATFKSEAFLSAQPDLRWVIAGTGDFNADYAPDIVWHNIATGENKVVYISDGVEAGSDALPAIDPQWRPIGPGGRYNPGGRADLDWDGNPDLVLQDWAGQPVVWLMNGTRLRASQPLMAGGTAWRVAALADFDGDGGADIVWQDPTGEVAVWLMNGTAMRQSVVLSEGPTDWRLVGAADLDGDGKPDLVWQHPNSAVAVWLMNGTAFKTAAVLCTRRGDWRVAATGDFNRDGKVDLVWQNATGEVAVWLMDGLTFRTEVVLSDTATDWRVIGAAQLNSDAVPDLIWRHPNGDVRIWPTTGMALDVVPIPVGTILGPAVSYNPHGRVDLDWDGHTDLVLQDLAGQPVVWLMTGTTLRASQPLMAGGTAWRVAALADFDGDGGADIVWQDPTGKVAVWLMNGTTMRESLVLSEAPTDWRLVAAGDLDGDGKTDLVWQHPAGFVAVWLMNGTAFKTGLLLSGGLTDWRVVATGDFDGDGKTDLVWQHPTGRVALWLMDGLTFRTGALVSGDATDWRVIGAGHFNGDASPDLVWRHPNGDIRIWPTVGLLLDGLPIIVGTIL